MASEAARDRDLVCGSKLAEHYSLFDVSSRILLTGHSHQAWPDCARSGVLEAFADAARWADQKWERAFHKAELVRNGFARLLNDETGHYALGASTHEVVLRFLSGLPLTRRPRIVTTSGEFHSLRRQLHRLRDAGIELVEVPVEPVDTVAERLAVEVDGRTAVVACSMVFFSSGRRVESFTPVVEACERDGVPLLVDVYHAVNVFPIDLRALGLQQAFLTGGGYKYCQLGEGNCFLRVPPDCGMQPLITGWFAEFGRLSEPTQAHVWYPDGHARFAGATYDPTSHYRAARVLEFFRDHRLSPDRLRELGCRQMALLMSTFDELDLPSSIVRRDDLVPEQLGGFLCVHSPVAPDLVRALASRGVSCDSRADSLRLGPAPYVSDAQIRDAMAHLGEVVRIMASRPSAK